MSDDIFDGPVGDRLDRLARRIYAVMVDAQCRDWTAERPDRVGFARLGQARHQVVLAAKRYGRSVPMSFDVAAAAVGAATSVVFAVLTLLLVDDPAAPLTLALTLAGALLVGEAGSGSVKWARRRRARSGPAPIDDPLVHADLTRRLEACAAAARSDPDPAASGAADELKVAIAWLDEVRDAMLRR
ncbi:hypothetical protein ACQP2F_38190 [Actinoplanes sp. CA-030573]|uniref:hypothetical protein n=1 Tax=Actinoplanes sp. CA-030573 TaxID=3239898 RepID=UPI003D8BB0E1